MPVALKPFRIGNVQVELPVVLGALAGYSDLAYRLICRRLGAPYCSTEMMLDKSLLAGRKLRDRMARLTEDDHPIAGQLMGNDPDTLADAARLLCGLGFDVVDLNFACPVRKALRRRRGGHLMRDPDLACRIVRAVAAAVDRPVTVKLRRSFEETDSTNAAFWQIAEASFEAGAAAVCLHARSVEAKYAGPADWNLLAEAKRRFADRTVIGSGDVLRPADALRMLSGTHVDAAAVARGALGNPWFFRHVRDLVAGRTPQPPALAEQRELLRAHFEHACRLYGPKRGPKMMRKFGIRYARVHPRPREVRAAFAAVTRPEDWHRVLDNLYADD